MASFFFFFNDTAPTEIYPLPLHDALPIYARRPPRRAPPRAPPLAAPPAVMHVGGRQQATCLRWFLDSGLPRGYPCGHPSISCDKSLAARRMIYFCDILQHMSGHVHRQARFLPLPVFVLIVLWGVPVFLHSESGSCSRRAVRPGTTRSAGRQRARSSTTSRGTACLTLRPAARSA